MVYTGSKLIAITKVYGEIYFIISVIRTKTIAVQIIDNINKYINHYKYSIHYNFTNSSTLVSPLFIQSIRTVSNIPRIMIL